MATFTTPIYGEESGTMKVARIRQTHEQLRLAWSNKFIQMALSYNNVFGEQLTPEQRKELTDQKRPALVFNFIQSKIITIAGIIETNMPYLRGVPTTEGDEKSADFHTRLVSDWAMQNCNAQSEFAKAAIDAAIAGYGVLNNYWTYQGDVEGKWVTKTEDPFSVLFDPLTRQTNGDDCRYYEYTGFYTAEEIIGIYSDILSDEIIEKILSTDERVTGTNRENRKNPISWAQRIFSGVGDFIDNLRGNKSSQTYEQGTISDFVDARNGRYRVIEFHDRRIVTRKLLYCPITREKIPCPEMTKGEMPGAYKRRMRVMAEYKTIETGKEWIYTTFPDEQIWKTIVCPYLLPDDVINEQPYKVQGAGFQHKILFCYDFHNDITKLNSIIDVLIDPQSSYNQRRMTWLETIMDSVRPDIWFPENSISPKSMDDWKSKERGKLLSYIPKQGLKPERIYPQPSTEASLKAFSDEDRDLSEYLTNITPNTQGMAEDGGESGILFARRVQQSLTALSYYMSHVRMAMAQCFTYCDKSLQKNMTIQRKIRLLTNGKPEWITVNAKTLEGVQYDIKQGEYDFIVDTKQLGETAKQIKFAEAMQFVGVIAQYFPDGVDFSKLFDLWDSPVAEEMGEFAKTMMQLKLSQMGMQMGAQQQQQRLQTAQAVTGIASQADALAAPQPDTSMSPQGAAQTFAAP